MMLFLLLLPIYLMHMKLMFRFLIKCYLLNVQQKLLKQFNIVEKKDPNYGCNLSQDGKRMLESIKMPDAYSKFIKHYVLNEDGTLDIIISIDKSD